MFIVKESNIEKTKNFKKWFGNSKVVKNGKPLIVFHGSNQSFDVFDIKKIGSHTDVGMWGKGFYFTNNEKTSKAYGNNVSQFYLKMNNPFIINDYKTKEDMAEYLEISEDILIKDGRGLIRPLTTFVNQFTSEVKYKGHDGIILNRDVVSEYIVFKPNQIKSVNNNGSFSKSDNVYN